MSVFDSNPNLKFVLLPVLLAACVTTGSNEPELSALVIAAHSDADSKLSSTFNDVCVAANGFNGWLEKAQNGDWNLATDDQLQTAGLGRLRKIVLDIPGGGGRYSEKQELYQRTDKVAGTITLALEQGYGRGKLLSSSCAIYGSGEILAECEAIGKTIKKQPDRNRSYPDKQARFINWKARINGKAANIACEQAPLSSILPYTGVTLTLTIDETDVRPKAISPIPGHRYSNASER